MTTEPPGPPPANEPDPATGESVTGSPSGSETPPQPPAEPEAPRSYTPPAGGFPPQAPPPPPPPPPGGFVPPAAPPPFGGAAGPTAAAEPNPLAAGVVVRYAFEKFKANPVVWIVGVLALLVIAAVVQGVFGQIGDDETVGAFWTIGSIVGSLVGFVVSTFVAAAITRAALEETSGVKATFASFTNFSGINIGQLLLASVIIGIAESIGTVLCIVPGIIVGLVTCFVLPFMIDEKQDAITAIKSSWNLWSKNTGTLIGPALALFGLVIAGAIACGVGLLVTLPMAYIGINYGYRVLTGKHVG